MKVEERKENVPFTVHGAFYHFMSGRKETINFDLTEINGELKLIKPSENLKRLKLSLEEMWGKLEDPILYGGCKYIKVKYLGDPEYHWI